MPNTMPAPNAEVTKANVSWLTEFHQWYLAKPPKRRFALMAVIREDGNAFGAVVPLLPGAVTFGNTLDEAKENIKEAAAGVIESYLENEGNIPWRDEPLHEDRTEENDILFAFSVDV